MAGSFSPRPSFHLCSDFNISPPPDGHLALGSVLAGLDIDSVLCPLDLGEVIPVPEPQLQPRDRPQEKTGFSRSMRELRGIEGSLWARITGGGVPGQAFSFLAKRNNDETLTVDKIFVRYFNPTMEYIEQALGIKGVEVYVLDTQQNEPVFLVTGLMWTEGAKLSKIQSKEKHLDLKVSAAEPHQLVSAGMSIGGRKENSVSSSFDGSTPFILGIRVRRIWWDKEGARRDALETAGTTLGGTGVKTAMVSGLQFADDEVLGQGGRTVVEDITWGGSDLVNWVLP